MTVHESRNIYKYINYITWKETKQNKRKGRQNQPPAITDTLSPAVIPAVRKTAVKSFAALATAAVM